MVCLVHHVLYNNSKQINLCFIYKELCLVMCDFQVLNYLPKIVLPSSKFDKVLILFVLSLATKIN